MSGRSCARSAIPASTCLSAQSAAERSSITDASRRSARPAAVVASPTPFPKPVFSPQGANCKERSRGSRRCHCQGQTCVKHVGSSADLVNGGLGPQGDVVANQRASPRLEGFTESAGEPACSGGAWSRRLRGRRPSFQYVSVDEGADGRAATRLGVSAVDVGPGHRRRTVVGRVTRDPAERIEDEAVAVRRAVDQRYAGAGAKAKGAFARTGRADVDALVILAELGGGAVGVDAAATRRHAAIPAVAFTRRAGAPTRYRRAARRATAAAATGDEHLVGRADRLGFGQPRNHQTRGDPGRTAQQTTTGQGGAQRLDEVIEAGGLHDPFLPSRPSRTASEPPVRDDVASTWSGVSRRSVICRWVIPMSSNARSNDSQCTPAGAVCPTPNRDRAAVLEPCARLTPSRPVV